MSAERDAGGPVETRAVWISGNMTGNMGGMSRARVGLHSLIDGRR